MVINILYKLIFRSIIFKCCYMIQSESIVLFKMILKRALQKMSLFKWKKNKSWKLKGWGVCMSYNIHASLNHPRQRSHIRHWQLIIMNYNLKLIARLYSNFANVSTAHSFSTINRQGHLVFKLLSRKLSLKLSWLYKILDLLLNNMVKSKWIPKSLTVKSLSWMHHDTIQEFQYQQGQKYKLTSSRIYSYIFICK